ncbi:MAG: FecR family protein [Ignavibacteriales bacterium]
MAGEAGPIRLDEVTRDEAAAWFAALRRGPMTLDERAAFDAWRSDPKNQAALGGMHELWGELSGLRDMGVTAPKPARPGRRWAAIAASVAVLIGGASVALLHPFGHTIRTHVGEQRTASLDDGSVVGLNVATKVSYDITPERRSVRMDDGEAVFFVKKDTRRPFLVRAGDYRIGGTGTFNVRCRDGDLDVAVTDGVLTVADLHGRKLADLAAGQRLRLSPDGRPVVTPVDAASVAEWRLRIVGYEDATVGQVVEDLNRFYDRPIEVDDPGLAARRVTLRLQVEDRERTLKTLGDLLGAEIERGPQADLLVSEKSANG